MGQTVHLLKGASIWNPQGTKSNGGVPPNQAIDLPRFSMVSIMDGLFD